MRAAQRNAKIARAGTLRPWKVTRGVSLHGQYRELKAGRHHGDHALRTCCGEAPVEPTPVIISKHELRRQRIAAARLSQELFQ